MKKSELFLENGLLVQNDKYLLRAICEEDKSEYLKLYRENSIVAQVFATMKDEDYEDFAELVWKNLFANDDIYVSVFSKVDNSYLGNITLKNLSSETPEIGISVLMKYHRKGIAFGTIQLFARRIMELLEIKYFSINIYSDNNPSIQLFQKLGATQIGREPSEYAKALLKMKELSKEEYESFMERNPNAEDIMNERYIINYRYNPK